jgi:hypothetical protein
MFYVYIIEDKITKEYYIGSRKYNGRNIENDKYLGSPHVWKPNINNLVKKIIKTGFDSMNEAILYERELIINSINDPLNRNYSIPHGRFHRSDLITAINNNGKIVSICKNDPLFGIEYFGVTKGKVLVKDKYNNTFFVSVTDERYLKGDFIHNNIGIMPSGKDHPNWGKKQINDGFNQKLVLEEELSIYLENGWKIGTLQKDKRTISSHYDRVWITNGVSNKRLKEEDLIFFIEKGWKKGRTFLKKYNTNKK